MTLGSPVTLESLSTVKIAFATPSLGMNKIHTLEKKFSALQASGYKYAELGFGNYMEWVRQQEPKLWVQSFSSSVKRNTALTFILGV
jgi:hypothetical protein